MTRTALLSSTPVGLQYQLNVLYDNANRLGLLVNLEKTRIVVFSVTKVSPSLLPVLIKKQKQKQRNKQRNKQSNKQTNKQTFV